MTDPRSTQLAPGLHIHRIVNGLWQVSGTHGPIDPQAAVPQMLAYHDAGFTTWDVADHYGPAEEFIGAFRRMLAATRGAEALGESQALTKWVPQPGPMSRQTVEQAIGRSLRRMGVETLDLLQFHWWDYRDQSYLDALDGLAALQAAGVIRHLALTNFDTERLRVILERGIRIVSNQVQYSLVDRRPEMRMVALCQQHGVQLLTYGTLCGGLVAEAWIGKPEPTRAQLATASLRKYKQMIDAWGGWDLFQDLLAALKQVADRHSASIANVAVRAILDRPFVAGVIIGARLGVAEHIAENARAFALQLDQQDLNRINAVLRRGNDLFRAIGDCGDEYRR
jgi:aryl-alcohol dehydrogenase-like predicted oxidoreductase